jgi:3',5'-cyclic-AMP phosphodiesterase
VLIAQLSDVHVRPVGQLYKGVADSNRHLSEAIAHLHALDRRPDLVVVSGDLVDEGHPDEYAHAAALLAALHIPYRVMPGNHDERGALRAAFVAHDYLSAEGSMHFCLDDHPVRIIALDTTVPGRHHGHIDANGLDWLRSVLEADTAKPTVVFMHHPPFVSGISYLDAYRLIDEKPLAQVIGAFDNIHAVLCGHVHRTMLRRWAGTVVCCCPSTTTQIALELMPKAKPESFVGPAACMLHLWDAEHGLVSHTSYIGDYPGPYPFF